MQAGGNYYVYHFDGTGHTVALTDKSNVVTHKYAYSPYGKVLGQVDVPSQPFKYAGQVGIFTESENLYYMRARYYDAEVGRFISEDPAGFVDGPNLYAYVGGNPSMLVDPSGLGAEGEVNLLKATVGTVNMVRGTVGMASGVAVLTGSAAVAPIIGPLAAPAAAVGSVQVAFGYANLNRGAGQFSESLTDNVGATPKNLLGLAPFGQEFDDIGEPGAFEYFGNQANKFVTQPVTTTVGVVKDFFALE